MKDEDLFVLSCAVHQVEPGEMFMPDWLASGERQRMRAAAYSIGVVTYEELRDRIEALRGMTIGHQVADTAWVEALDEVLGILGGGIIGGRGEGNDIKWSELCSYCRGDPDRGPDSACPRADRHPAGSGRMSDATLAAVRTSLLGAFGEGATFTDVYHLVVRAEREAYEN